MQTCQSWMFKETWHLQRQREENVISRQNEKDSCTHPRLKNRYLLTPLNLTDSAVKFLKTNEENTYQCPEAYLHRKIEANLPLTAWHKRLGHLNFQSLKRHLQRLSIDFIDNSKDYVCDRCQRVNGTRSIVAMILKSSPRPLSSSYIKTC